MHILQLTLTGLENYEQREPWTATNEDNKTPLSLDQYEFLPIMKLFVNFTARLNSCENNDKTLL